MLLKSILLDYFDALSGKEKTRENVAPYVTDEALIEHIEMTEKAFPRYELKAEDIIEQDDKVVVRSRFIGTHRGEFNGIPATGKSIDIPVIIIYRFDGGKIAEHWMEFNHLALLTQLGVMNTEAQPA